MKIIELGSGKCSYFGGPMDSGVGAQEGLGLIEPSDLTEWWFRRLFAMPGSYDNGKGLARNLNPSAFYCAMRFGYGSFAGVAGEILPGYSRTQIQRMIFAVTANGNTKFVQAADWGPNTDTGRLIDLSPGVCKALCISTDDVVSVEALVS